MRNALIGVVGLLCFVVVGCGAKPKDQIIGKWEAQNKQAKELGVVTEFNKDGTGTLTMKFGPASMSMPYKYKFSKDDEVELTIDDGKGKTDTKKFKVEIKGDELTTTELEGKKEVEKYKKVK